MKVTKENIKSIYPKIKHLLNDVEKETYENIDDLLFMYDEDDNCKGSVDWLVVMFQKRIDSIEEESQPKVPSKPKEPYEAPTIVVTEEKKKEKKPNSIYVVYHWSESSILNKVYNGREDVKTSFGLFYNMTKKLNETAKSMGGYSKTKFSIMSVIDGEDFNYNDARYDIGSERGDIIEHIKYYAEYQLNGLRNPTTFPFNQYDDETIKEEIETMNTILNKFVPFLESQKNVMKNSSDKHLYNKFLDLLDDTTEPETPPTVVEPTPKAPTKKPTKKPKKEYDAKEVEQVLEEKIIIGNFVKLRAYKGERKRDRSLTLLNRLQKDIIKKVIRKSSQYADDLKLIQDVLVKFLNGKIKDYNRVVSDEEAKRMEKIAKSEKESMNVKLVSTFISTYQAKSPDKEKTKGFFKKINEAIANEIVSPEVKELAKPINDYLDGKTKTVEANTKDLRGICGLSGVDDVIEEATQNTMSSYDLLNREFQVLNLGSRWSEFFGKPSQNFKFMFYGRPGNGKSTFALRFAGHLAKNLGFKVLFASSEEKFGYTLKEKIMRMGVAHENLMISEDLNCNLDDFDVIFIDSVNDMKLTTADLKSLPQNKAYVYIFQCTKEGTFRGDQGFEHDVDTVVRVEQMRAITEKNRFGTGGKEFDVQ